MADPCDLDGLLGEITSEIRKAKIASQLSSGAGLLGVAGLVGTPFPRPAPAQIPLPPVPVLPPAPPPIPRPPTPPIPKTPAPTPPALPPGFVANDFAQWAAIAMLTAGLSANTTFDEKQSRRIAEALDKNAEQDRRINWILNELRNLRIPEPQVLPVPFPVRPLPGNPANDPKPFDLPTPKISPAPAQIPLPPVPVRPVPQKPPAPVAPPVPQKPPAPVPPKPPAPVAPPVPQKPPAPVAPPLQRFTPPQRPPASQPQPQPQRPPVPRPPTGAGPRLKCNWTPQQISQVTGDTGSTNAFLTGTYWLWVEKQWKNLFDLVGSVPLVGGITGTLGNLTVKVTNFAKSSVASRAWSALTLMVVLHNAAMLSRDLVQTMGDTLSTGLAVIGITDENDSPIDINKILGQRADQFMAAVLGADNWKGLKKNWALASRTVQAASNVVYTMRSIMDSSLEVGVWTAEQVAKIGNGLKADGVVDRFRYPTMPEIYVPGNRILAKLANLDDAASSLSMVTSELLSVKEESEELADQASEFYNARKDLMKSLSGGGKVDDLTKKQIEDQLKKESQIDEDSRSPELPPSAFLEGKE